MIRLPSDGQQAVQIIRDLADQYRSEREMYFIEETHKYGMTVNGIDYSSKIPSVSKIYKKFKVPFDSVGKSLKKAGGDPVLAEQIRNEWAANGARSATKGSYCHYHLELGLWEKYRHKDISLIREPDIGDPSGYIDEAEGMIQSGFGFIEKMESRGAILIDTEAVMGHLECWAFGQADKFWLVKMRSGNWGLLCTDWKTNDPSKFDIAPWTKNMLGPYSHLPDNSFGEYSAQLTMYSVIFQSMMMDMGLYIPYVGSIIVNITPSHYMEYRVESGVYGISKYVLENHLHVD